MKNKDLHDGLDKKEIRDFLSKQYQKEGRECNWSSDIEFLEKELEKHKKMLESAYTFKGIKHLINIQGWRNFDVSDNIENYDKDNYFEFIGTDEEFKNLLNKQKTTGDF